MASLADLVAAAQAGDEAAFRTLLEREAQWAFGVAVAVAGSSAEADDVFQEATLRAWRDLPRLRDPQRWSAWFRRIVTNAAVDIARKTRRSALYMPVRRSDEPDVARAAESADGMRRVLDRLAPDERALIVLRYGRDLELPVVADLMGLHLGTAKSRLHRTLNKVRRMLEAES